MDLAQFDALAARVEELVIKWQDLARQNQELVAERDELLALLKASEQELDNLRRERDLIRSRVDGLLNRLSESVA